MTTSIFLSLGRGRVEQLVDWLMRRRLRHAAQHFPSCRRDLRDYSYPSQSEIDKKVQYRDNEMGRVSSRDSRQSLEEEK
jgi:response regulator of citrate/malate metabolism